jgi:hypothetical protein
MGEGGKPAACSTGEGEDEDEDEDEDEEEEEEEEEELGGRSRFSRAERRVVKSWWVGPGGRRISAVRRRGWGRRMGKVSSRGKRSGVR